MPRLPRPDYEHTYHHVVVRGVDGLPIFDSHKKKQRYVDLMVDVRESHDLSVYAVGFVSNHVHQFIRRNNQSMGVFYRRVNGRYARWYNWSYKRTGSLYDRRYYSTLVDSEAYFQAMWRYVHHQGVKAGLHETVSEDPWSSAGIYLGTSERFSWIDWREALDELDVRSGEDGSRIIGRKGAERAWYEEDQDPYEIHRDQRFLAREPYLEKFMQIRKHRVRQGTREETPVSWDTLVKVAQRLSGMSGDRLLEPSQESERVKHRSGLAYAGRRFGHLSLSEIADHLAVSQAAASIMIKRVKERYDDLRRRWNDELANGDGG